MATDIPGGNGNTIAYRLVQVEKEDDRLHTEKARADDLRKVSNDLEQRARAADLLAVSVKVDGKASLRDLDALAKEVETLSSKVAANTRALVGFALTVAVAALGVAFAVLQSGGHP